MGSPFSVPLERYLYKAISPLGGKTPASYGGTSQKLEHSDLRRGKNGQRYFYGFFSQQTKERLLSFQLHDTEGNTWV